MLHSILEAKNDISARVHPRLDIKGKKCALLKVRIVGQEVTFGEGVVGDVELGGKSPVMGADDVSIDVEFDTAVAHATDVLRGAHVTGGPRQGNGVQQVVGVLVVVVSGNLQLLVEETEVDTGIVLGCSLPLKAAGIGSARIVGSEVAAAGSRLPRRKEVLGGIRRDGRRTGHTVTEAELEVADLADTLHPRLIGNAPCESS